ncbi:hypothetical protein [Paraglaciecola sp. L3A3]|uniref:hypothetical protein n=1 Tax=Paraglaciecola sp. L3A3 TaxID=2686358 RepID=UPI00131EA636|nr:hypothetical protein [Paraglaciecola sp. L3A3]
MTCTSHLLRQYIGIKGQVIAVFFTVLTLLTVSLPTQALELGVNAQQGTEYETQGFSIVVSDNFSRRSPFYWNLGFSRYDEIFVEWNNSDLRFPINSAEVSFSYRPPPSSRNPTMRRISMEYQLGVAASLTDNKFTWTELNEEKYFSETGDLNGFVAISANYKISPKMSANLGLKHYPKLSEFGSFSSVFLGIKFNLDFSPTYYGR